MSQSVDYVDILFLAALEEELFVLRDLLARSSKMSTQITEHGTDACIFRLEDRDVRIGWRDLGGMGNVGAYQKAQEWITRTCPRAVVLIGVAGAPKDGILVRGDVAYASQVGYGSFGKIEDVPFGEWLRSEVESIPEQAQVHLDALEEHLGKMQVPQFRLRHCTPIDVGPDFLTFARTTEKWPTIPWQDLAVEWRDAGAEEYLLQYADKDVAASEVDIRLLTEAHLESLGRHAPSARRSLQEFRSSAKDANALAALASRIIGGPELSTEGIDDSRLKYVLERRHRVALQVYIARSNRIVLERILCDILKPKVARLFQRGTPNAKETVFASGEAIIASGSYQGLLVDGIRQIDRRKKLQLDAGAFEMESYGVALCCSERSVPFAVVKGISDLADDTKTDGYRLAALCSATAFSLAMVLNKSHLSKILKGARHGWSERACVWESDGERRACGYDCESGEVARFSRWRNCTHSLFGSARQIDAVRVLDGVKSTDYSTYIEHALENSVVRLVFPYDAKELLEFLKSTILRDGPVALDRLARRKHHGSKGRMRGHVKTLKQDAITIGEESYQRHSHFRASNELCAKKIGEDSKLQFHELARHVCRLVSVSYKDIRAILDDPAYLLHVRMCGICVPMILAKRNGDARYDEATFVVRGAGVGVAGSPGKTSTCMKYLQESGLLMVFGSCSLTPPAGRHRLFKALSEVERWLDIVSGKPTETCRDAGLAPFPVLMLLRHHGIDPMTFLPNSASASSNENFQMYFRRLEEVERRYWQEN